MTTSVPRREVFGEPRHALELERVFARTWQFVGHESEIPDVGSWVTRTLVGNPVIMVRGEDGVPRVLLNSCAHRGTQLCRADVGSGSRFRCMYHGWVYDTDGNLRGVPGLRAHYPPEFDRAQHGLRRARVDTCHGLVFATWDADAEPLADYLGEFIFYLDSLLGRARDGWEVVGEPLRWASQANWKISVENFGMDSLHLGVLHEGAGKLGIFGATETPPTAYSIVCKRGHVVEATKLAADEPHFPGYPPQLWPEFSEALDPAQRWFASNNLVCKGNIFPNLGFIDLCHDYTGDPGAPPVAGLMLRLVQPVAVDSSEVWMWILVPCAAPEQWKRWSQESLVRTLGPSGTFEPDDLENTGSISVANAAGQARDGFLLVTAGSHLTPVDTVAGHELPGTVHAWSANTETMQRGFFAELDRLTSK